MIENTPVRIEQTLYDRLAAIAQLEHRTIAKQVNKMLSDSVDEYESKQTREYGTR